MGNTLVPGLVGDLTDEQLREAREAGMAAFSERRAPLYAQRRGLLGDGKVHGTIHQTFLLDSALVNAFEALQAEVDPRSPLRWFEKFEPASPQVPNLQAAVPSYVALEQGYFTARAANSVVAALDAEKLALELAMYIDESIEAERDIRLATDELRRRGKPVKVPKP
jgi:hypothetical protein